MRDDYMILAEAERFVGGDVAERREKIRRAGRAGKLPHTREFDPVTTLPAVLYVQRAGWLLEPDWEHNRLAHTPQGLEVRISRKDLVDCFHVGSTAPEPNRGGRKPKGATRDVEMLKEIVRRIEAGEVSLMRGKPTKAAREIREMEEFKSYEIDTIRRKIVRELESRRQK